MLGCLEVATRLPVHNLQPPLFSTSEFHQPASFNTVLVSSATLRQEKKKRKMYRVIGDSTNSLVVPNVPNYAPAP